MDSTWAQVLFAFTMVGLLGLILRWTFSPDVRSGDVDVRAVDADEPTTVTDDDFGLLAPVAVVDSAEEAADVRAQLVDAGIRATTSVGPDGRHRVLVFSSQLERARHLGPWSG